MARLVRHEPEMIRRCFPTEKETKHVPAVAKSNVGSATRQLTAELPSRPVPVGLWESHVTRSNPRSRRGLSVPRWADVVKFEVNVRRGWRDKSTTQDGQRCAKPRLAHKTDRRGNASKARDRLPKQGESRCVLRRYWMAYRRGPEEERLVCGCLSTIPGLRVAFEQTSYCVR
ncbi:hypothetical protein VTK26DRAFT_8516 [Humicola hyalothermophila]